jgi:hypothetical protein
MDRNRGIGNAVVPQVAEVVGRVVLAPPAREPGGGEPYAELRELVALWPPNEQPFTFLEIGNSVLGEIAALLAAHDRLREEAAAEPMQPLVWDDTYLRFQENTLVRWLLYNGGRTMNDLIRVPATHADRRQFAQLIGYSVGGYSGLSYVDDAAYERVKEAADRARSARGAGTRTEGGEHA